MRNKNIYIMNLIMYKRNYLKEKIKKDNCSGLCHVHYVRISPSRRGKPPSENRIVV